MAAGRPQPLNSDPLVCYLCLGAFNGDHLRADRLAGCASTSLNHAQFFHEACGGGEARTSCPLCKGTAPMALLCASAGEVVGKEQAPPAHYRRFLAEILRLLPRATDATNSNGPTKSNPQGEATASAFCGAGGCVAVWSVLGRAKDDAETTAAALHVLLTLAETGYRDPDHKLAPPEAGAVLTRALEAHRGQQDVAVPGLEAVIALVAVNSSLVASLHKAGAMPTVVAVVRAFLKTLIRIWAPGLRALRILLHHNIGRTNQASLDGCDALHQMLKLCTGDQWDAGSPALNKELKRRLCQVISELSSDEASAKIFHDQGTSRYLCVLMTKTRFDADIQLSACRAVCVLATYCPPAGLFFRDYLPALLKRMLESHPDSSAVLEAALGTARTLLASDPQSATALGEYGLCEAILWGLQQSEESVVVEALRLLLPMTDKSPQNLQYLNSLQLVELLKSTRARLGVKRDTAPALLEELTSTMQSIEALTLAQSSTRQLNTSGNTPLATTASSSSSPQSRPGMAASLSSSQHMASSLSSSHPDLSASLPPVMQPRPSVVGPATPADGRSSSGDAVHRASSVTPRAADLAPRGSPVNSARGSEFRRTSNGPPAPDPASTPSSHMRLSLRAVTGDAALGDEVTFTSGRSPTEQRPQAPPPLLPDKRRETKTGKAQLSGTFSGSVSSSSSSSSAVPALPSTTSRNSTVGTSPGSNTRKALLSPSAAPRASSATDAPLSSRLDIVTPRADGSYDDGTGKRRGGPISLSSFETADGLLPSTPLPGTAPLPGTTPRLLSTSLRGALDKYVDPLEPALRLPSPSRPANVNSNGSIGQRPTAEPAKTKPTPSV